MTTLAVTFKREGESALTVQAPEGASLLQVAQEAGMPLEGSCDGNMACATCHVVVAEDWYAKLVPPVVDEIEMLDFAPGLCATSRLSCQVRLARALDGLTVLVPDTEDSPLGF